MKNIILSVTLKNDVFKYENNFQGTYEISDMVNGKPSWIFHENQRTIWYHPEQEHWKIGALKNLGKPSSSLHSIVNGDFDPHNIPSNKWNYYNSKDKVWKVTDKDGVFALKRFIAAHSIILSIEGVPAFYFNSILGGNIRP